MNSHSLLDRRGWKTKALLGGSPERRGPRDDVLESAKGEAKWQRHVVEGLWVFLALLIVVCAALLYAKTHGLFDFSPGQTPLLPPWPEGS
jgi:hypothetical protein